MPWLLPLCALLVAVTALPPPAGPVEDLAFAQGPQVLDPQPAPGSLVSAGPVVLAARVIDAGEDEVTFLLDDEPVDGPVADPDGDLTDLAGIEVTLPAGSHRIGVRVGEAGVLRQWEVVASGLQIDTISDDAEALLDRFDTAPADGPSVVVNTDDPEALAALPVLLRRTGGQLVPMAGTRLSLSNWAALRRTGAPVLLVGDESLIGADIGQQITEVGLTFRRLAGGSGPEVALAVQEYLGSLDAPAAPGLLVGPARPLAEALSAAVAAADLGTDLLLIDRALSLTARERLDATETALLADGLSEGQQQLIRQALPADTDVSPRQVQPAPAQEALVVSDVTDRPRAVLMAALSTPDRPVLLGSRAAATWVGSARPDRVTVIAPLDPGGPIDLRSSGLPAFATATAVDGAARAVVIPRPLVVPPLLPSAPAVEQGEPTIDSRQVDELRDQLRRVVVDGADPPEVQALLDATAEAPSITVSSPASISDASIHVQVLAYEWPGTVTVEDGVATWTAGDRPALPVALERANNRTPTAIRITTEVTAAGRVAHRTFDSVVGLDPLDGVSDEGWIVAGGTDNRVGLTGRLYTYSVEVEPETGLDIDEVEAEVSAILSDERSWTADGAVSFRRVGPDQRARIRVVVARPATVDDFCGRVGLSTGGRVSCWDGYRAMLNLDRWNLGVPPFHADLTVYRQYLVNHEVGHGLGHGHEFCTQPGALAPVMMQQTGGIGACQANGWPFPSAG